MTAQEKGRVLGTLAVVKLILDGLCDTTAPCTGSDVLIDAEFQALMAMADRVDRIMVQVSTRQ